MYTLYLAKSEKFHITQAVLMLAEFQANRIYCVFSPNLSVTNYKTGFICLQPIIKLA